MTRFRRVLGIAVVWALVVSGCGGNADESVAEAGEETAGETTSTAAESAAPEGTEATDQPGDTPGTVDPSSFALDPLVDGDAGASLWSAVIDAHGMTDDVAREINRVAEFPAIPTPSDGAFLVSVWASLEVTDRNEAANPETLKGFTIARFLVSTTTGDALTFYETSLAPLGWSRTSIEEGDDVNGIPFTKVDLRRLDDEDDSDSLEVTISDVRGEDLVAPTEVRMQFFNQDDLKVESLPRSGQWADEFAPEGALLVETTVGSSYSGIVPESQMRVSAEYNHSSSRDEIIANVEQAAAARGAETELTDTGINVLDGPIAEIKIEVYDDRMEVESFDNVLVMDLANVDLDAEGGTSDPADSASNTGVLQLAEASEPLPDFATPDQIEAAVSDIYGPIDDISVEMARLGRFPVVPTPDGAEVRQLQHQLSEIINADELLAVSNYITVEVADATVDDVVVFYDTQLTALGWKKTGSEEKDSTDEGERYVTQTYSIGELEAGLREPLMVSVNDERGGVTWVTVTYSEWVDRSAVNVDRWLGWQGETPLPDGGRLSRLGMTSNALPGAAGIFVFYGNSYDAVDRDTIRADVEALVPGSDYSIDGANSTEYVLGLSHPDFESGELSFVSAATRQLEVTMRLPLE